MGRQSIGYILLSVLFVACTHNSESTLGRTEAPVQPAGPSGPVEVSGSQNYLQTQGLVAVQTGEALTLENFNQVKFSGQGTQSSYRVRYQFNSRDSISLKLLEVVAAQSATADGTCFLGNPVVTLIQGSSQQVLTTLKRVELQAQTDSALDVLYEQNCPRLDLSVGVRVWLGNDTYSDPFLARKCFVEPAEELVFFPVHAATVFSSLQPGRPFVSTTNYCGQPLVLAPHEIVKCDRDYSNSSGFKNSVECKAGSSEQGQSFAIHFSADRTRGTLQCEQRGQRTYSAELFKCEDLVLDLRRYY